MNELTIFKNDNFGEVRAITIEGEPYFCLVDVCRILDLGNPRQVKKRLGPSVISSDAWVETGTRTDGTTATRKTNMNFINEPNLYKCIFQSRKPEAEKFQSWIFTSVIPQVRKTGIYATKEMITKILNDPSCVVEIFSKLQSLQDRCQTLELSNNQSKQLIGELQPKATYYDLILQNKSTIPITQIAKDYGMSGVAFNKMLHELGIQYKMGQCWLLYQEYADYGYTQSKVHVVDAEKSVMRTQWTQKGRIFIYDTLKTRRQLLPIIERGTENKDFQEEIKDAYDD